MEECRTISMDDRSAGLSTCSMDDVYGRQECWSLKGQLSYGLLLVPKRAVSIRAIIKGQLAYSCPGSCSF